MNCHDTLLPTSTGQHMFQQITQNDQKKQCMCQCASWIFSLGGNWEHSSIAPFGDLRFARLRGNSERALRPVHHVGCAASVDSAWRLSTENLGFHKKSRFLWLDPWVFREWRNFHQIYGGVWILGCAWFTSMYIIFISCLQTTDL